MKGNAQLLARSLPDGEKSRGKADLIVREATRLEKLTNDLLEFARAGEIQLADVDPVALVREVVEAMGNDRVDVEVAQSLAPPPTWPLDADRMRQVLTNLIENALQASDGRVTVRVHGDRGLEPRFTISDRGPGVPVADRERIFEPFVTTRTQGTGLGLAVARRIMDQHGGTIEVDEAEGGGAAFTVHLRKR